MQKDDINGKKTVISTSKWENRGLDITAITGSGYKLKMGGGGDAPNPVEILLSSLGGCIAELIAALSFKEQILLDDLTVIVEGDLDTRGISPKQTGIRAGLSEIRYKIDIKSSAPQEKIDRLIEMAEKYCPVKDTLKGVSVIRAEN